MTTITVEALTVDGPPQAGVTVGGLDAGNQVISVQVSVDGGDTYLPVSGGTRITAVGGKFVRDYFPPLNLASQWRVIEHSVAGEPTTESALLTVTSTTSWLQDPLNPRDGVRIDGVRGQDGGPSLLMDTANEASWKQSADYAQVLGADRPVGSIGQRQAPSDVPLSIMYETEKEGGKFKRLLMTSGALVLRMHKPTMLDPVAFIAIGDAAQRVSMPASSDRIDFWDLTVTQVRRISTAIVIPFYTYSDVKAMWPTTYADVYAARPGDTYVSWQRDPRP